MYMNCFLLALFTIARTHALTIDKKLCLDQNDRDACQQISRGGEIICQIVSSKVDCILDADNGLPVLSVLTAEEAFLGGALVTGQASVIGEILPAHEPYQTAVIVRKNFSGGFSVRGLRYCHPGYVHDELISKYVLEELDRKVQNLSCRQNATLVEQKFEFLATYFGDSCRPGRWTEDDALDAILKSRYSSLCSLCGTSGCNVKYQTPFKDSLSCLKDNGGDIALTTVVYAKEFFNNSNNANNFQYLCSDGVIRSSSVPCFWTQQMRRLIVTSSSSASIMRAYIERELAAYMTSGSSSSAGNPSLARVLNLNNNDKLISNNSVPLSNYVRERRDIPRVNESVQCGLTVNWSITNDNEFNKCKWLQQAALNVGLQPVISCVASQDNDTVSNLDNLKNGLADVAYTDANFGYIARRKDLTNISYPETDIRQLSKIVIVINNNTTWSGNFADLKGKRICLPEYGGKEWLAFVDLLRENNLVENSCDYGKIFSDFVGVSCAPGANSKDLDIPNTDSSKLCENCLPVDAQLTAKYCNADHKNKYYDSYGALTCLSDGNGDYAVIAVNDLPPWYSRQKQLHQKFRVVSKNGSLAQYGGFDVDDAAPLAIITAGEVLTTRNNAKLDDIVLLLKDLEKDFGQDLEKAFKVFEQFNHTRDLLFPDSTTGLTFSGTGNIYVQHFKRLLAASESCSTEGVPGGSTKLSTMFPTVILAFVLFALFNVV